MNMRSLTGLAVIAGAILAASLAPPAAAQTYTGADDKVVSGASCMPALGASYADWDIRATYIQNISSSNRWIACTIPVDAERRWATADSAAPNSGFATLRVYVRYGNTVGTSVCNAQVINLSTKSIIETSSVSIDGQKNTSYTRTFPSMYEGDGNSSALGVNCRLTPGARLYGFNIEEYADTHNKIVW